MKIRCVLLDDQTMFLQLLVAMVRSIPGLEVIGSFSRAMPALEFCLRHETDLMILDLEMPDGHGLSVFKAAVRKNRDVKGIILSGHASEFVCPADMKTNIRAVVDKTQAYGSLQKEIADMIRSTHSTYSGESPRELLTERERQIYSMVGQGRISKEIAAAVGISVRTVETHRKAICRKLKVSGPELVRQAAIYLQTNIHP